MRNIQSRTKPLSEKAPEFAPRLSSFLDDYHNIIAVLWFNPAREVFSILRLQGECVFILRIFLYKYKCLSEPLLIAALYTIFGMVFLDQIYCPWRAGVVVYSL